MIISFASELVCQREVQVLELSELDYTLRFIKSNNKLFVALSTIPECDISISPLLEKKLPGYPHEVVIVSLPFVLLSMVQKHFPQQLQLQLVH